MIDLIELIFYIIETVLLTAIFLLEVVQFRKEDQYMNGHKKSIGKSTGNSVGNSVGNSAGKLAGNSAGNVTGIKPFIAQAETDELDV